MSNRLLSATGSLLIAAGSLVLLFLLYEFVGTGLANKGHQNTLRKEFGRTRARQPLVADAGPPAPALRPGEPVGRLVIPALDLDVIVVEGTRWGDLAKGPGRYRSSADAGQPGSLAIAGHRTGWGAPFFDLDRLDSGDVIMLESADHAYTYRVTRSVVVGPRDGHVIDGDPRSRAKTRLTLTTCTPRFSTSRRLIVWADLANVASVATEPRAA